MDIFSPATPEQFFYNWWLFPLPLLVALATVFVPGLAVGRLVGLRNKWLWAWAPAASVGIDVDRCRKNCFHLGIFTTASGYPIAPIGLLDGKVGT